MLNTGIPAKCAAVTPSDTLGNSFAALYSGEAGTITITPEGGGSDVQWTVPAGGYVLCRCTKVKLTGTSSTKIIGLF